MRATRYPKTHHSYPVAREGSAIRVRQVNAVAVLVKRAVFVWVHAWCARVWGVATLLYQKQQEEEEEEEEEECEVRGGEAREREGGE